MRTMEQKITATFSVRLDKEDDQTQVTRTFDLKLLTVDDLIEFAMKTIIIDEQARIRRNAQSVKDIVLVKTVDVAKPGTRMISTQRTIKLLTKLVGDDMALKMEKKFGSAEKALEHAKVLIQSLDEEEE